MQQTSESSKDKTLAVDAERTPTMTSLVKME
jgi:hypothetical protein